MQQVMSHMNLEIPKYIRSIDPIFKHATFLHPAEVHTATQPLLKQPLEVVQESWRDCRESKLPALCHCTGHKGVKLEDIEVSGNCSGSSREVEIGVHKMENFSSQEMHILKRNSDSFNFMSTNALDMLSDHKVCSSDRNVDDPSEVLEEQSLKKVFGNNSTVSVLVDDNWFQNQSETMALDIGSGRKFCSNLPCNESVTDIIGLKMDLDTSFDEILSTDKISCDQNSLQVNDIIVESTLMNCLKCSCLIGSNSQCRSSINSTGCDRGTSSNIDMSYFLSVHATKPSPLHSVSSLSLQSLAQILEIEHNYSKKPSCLIRYKEGRCIQEKNSKVKAIKGSVQSLESGIGSLECKHLKTNRSGLQGTMSSHMPQSSSTQSTRKSEDEKQICDDEYGLGDTTMCSFCTSNYSSNICLFYRHWTASFANIPLGSQVSICECCDTDEEGDTDDVDLETCKSEGGDVHDSSEGKGSCHINKVSKVPNINPGWYGKGYRKRTKKKRLEKL